MTQKPFGVKDLLRPDAMASEQLRHKATIDYKSELVRKGIHLCSLAIPIIYFFISQRFALTLLIPIAAAFLLTDIARHYSPAIGNWYYRWFGWLLRQHEQDRSVRRLNGATNILLSAVICVALFPKIIVLNAFAILIVSDTTSALVGRRFGKHRLFNKSLEGTLAFFLSAMLVVFLAPKLQHSVTEYLLWVAGAGVGAVTEASVTSIDYNISVPLAIGLVLWGLYSVFLPGLDLNLMV